MKKVLFVLLAIALVFTTKVMAEEVNEEFGTTKYYKTVTDKSILCLAGTECNNSVTYEITKAEYDAFNGFDPLDATVETTYKKLTSTITQDSPFYKYKAKLTWKNIPSTRSYDIIGIGFYQSVKVLNDDIYFQQDYKQNGVNYTLYSSYDKVFAGGAGSSFLLPSGTLTSLSSELYFYVTKNTTATIISQLAAADYAHATSTISFNNSKKFSVGPAGIDHLDGTSSYYDAINTADEYWYGTW